MAEQLKPSGALAVVAAVVLAVSPSARASAVDYSRQAYAAVIAGDGPASSAGVTCRMVPAGVRQQESGGQYDVQGVPVASHGGDRAQGAYQVMPVHLVGPGSWARESLGRDVTPAEFRRSHALQDKLAGDQLGRLCRQHGPRGAIAAWYSGRPDRQDDPTPVRNGPSVKAYTDNVMALARRYGK